MFDRPTLLPAPTQNTVNVEKVCDLMHESGDSWDEGKLRGCFDEEICQRILCIPPKRAQGADRWMLKLHLNFGNGFGNYQCCHGIKCSCGGLVGASSQRWKHLNVGAWKLMRNAKKFSNEVTRAEKLWPKVERIMEEYQAANLTDLNNTTVLSVFEWEKPEYLYVKLNVDASVRREGGGYLGGLAMSLKKGLELALKICCTHVWVEGDASLVTDMLKTPCTHASALNAVRIDQRDAVWIDFVPVFLSEVLSFDE
ncbi:hypothetical protein G2W53_041391 [Senna tora]|uniref:RNase H type-1 domain-containing protein n=1 Tax=Senna tora TaxID=362788 RepID=A0A834VZ49_9FABA|nr:hypothetical protein G2W53_041391 [Senna tora]